MRYRLFLFASLLFFIATCGDSPYSFKDFAHSDPYKTESDFKNDSSKCCAEKEKHSHKIEGRKFGFKGHDTGYFGCMKQKGWNRISVPSGS